MNEAETRAEHIDPALKAAGWGVVEGSRVHREYRITEGRLEGQGRRAKPDIADYVLVYRNTKLAVVEAKAWDKELTEGVGQAKAYALKMAIRFAYATNGRRIYGMDLQAAGSPAGTAGECPGGYANYVPLGAEGEVIRYPTPDELWNLTYAERNAWRERFAAVPNEGRGGFWDPRYYQDLAIQRTLEAIAMGQKRILLTLATGTGKTAIAFQIAWKLFHSRWNLGSGQGTIDNGQLTIDNGQWGVDSEQLTMDNGEVPEVDPHYPLSTVNYQLSTVNYPLFRRPRILFLADRNDLADQAYNAFCAFPDDALVRIAPDEIKKKGKVPKNGSIFFTIFQTFLSGPKVDGKDTPYFGEYPPDFFDFIVIDECHRGGARDESTWRAILEYFAPAVQLGLTATPKRRDNVDTYAYFGEPVYVYSLKEGINDGFLTPFKVKQIATTLDEYVYTPDDDVEEGEIETGKRYGEKDFNRIIEIKAREAYRVKIFMEMIDQREKTLVFCATQLHALAVRDLINQMKTSTDPEYCVRVTADDGALGTKYLLQFKDNEKTIPTILTSSQKLSTGVDARNVRNIVLMRPINSMIEFKQIIGRGTRLYDGKDFFTIYDFVKAHHHFSDPEWDGEPIEPEPKAAKPPAPPVEPADPPEPPSEPAERQKKIKVKLADGKERTLDHMVATSFWSPDGTPISAQQFLQELYGALPDFFKDEAELRALWSAPDTRKAFLAGLSEKGYGRGQILELQRLIDAENSDLFDVLAYVAFALQPITREERAGQARIILSEHFNSKQRIFLEFVLAQYVKVGVDELDQDKLAPLLKLKYHNSLSDAIADLGQDVGNVFTGFQKYLYQRVV